MTVEHANGRGHRGGEFPDHWGLPEGRAFSEERTGWILRNIAEDKELERRGLNAAEVRSGKRPRTMSGPEALTKIKHARLT